MRGLVRASIFVAEFGKFRCSLPFLTGQFRCHVQLDCIESWVLGGKEIGLFSACFKNSAWGERVPYTQLPVSYRYLSLHFLPVLPSTTTWREEIPPLTVVTTTEQRLPDFRAWKLYLLVSLETLSFLMTTFSWINKTWQNSMSPCAFVQLANRLLVIPWLVTCKSVT